MRFVEPIGRQMGHLGVLIGRLSPRLTLWLAVVSSVAVFSIFGLVLYASRVDVQRAAWTASGNLVAAVGQQIQSEITTLDMSLLDLRDGAGRDDVMALPSHLRRAVLFDRVSASLGLGQMFLLDAMGRVIEQAGVAAPKPLDLSQQSFFTVHRDRDAGLFISHPFLSFLDGEPCIALSRRVSRDGVFAGVAVATVRLSHYKDLLSNLDLGSQGMSALFDTDGTLVMRQPFVQSLVDDQTWRLPVAEVMPDRSGNTEGVSHVDGVNRQVFYQRLGELPLIQVIGRGLDDIYATWWHRLWLTGLALFILGNVTLVLVIAQQAELRRRHAAEAALAILASTDKLTGLPNRRRFDEALGRGWRQARRERQHVALLMIDVDHFKALNDAIGHPGGDAALAAVGNCLSALPLPPGALAARYGGEEFAIVLPDVDEVAMVAWAETVRGAVAGLGLTHPHVPRGVLTVSIGVAAMVPGADEGSGILLAAADDALYRAKQGGRDRVVAATRPDGRGARIRAAA